MRNIITIAFNTFRESVRNRMMMVAMLMSAFFVLSTFYVIEFTISAWQKMVIEFGMSAMRLGAIVMVFLLGASVVKGELERRTVYVIFSKPVAKWEFIIGKFIGLMTLLAANMLVLFLLLCGVSYWVQESQGLAMPPIYLGYIDLLAELSILVSCVILFSILFSQKTALILFFCFLLFGTSVSFIKNSLYESKVGSAFAYLLELFPDLLRYTVREHLAYFVDFPLMPAKPIPYHDMAIAWVISIVYTVIFLGASAVVLNRKELKE